MGAELILRIVGLFTAGLILAVGVIVLSGSLLPASVPDNYRMIFGLVMVIYGSYRIAILWMKLKNARKD